MGSPKGAEAGTGIISLFLEEFKRMSPKRRRNWEIPKKTPAVHFPLSQGDWLCYAFRFIGSNSFTRGGNHGYRTRHVEH
jgi:hypothetical protein